MSRKKILITGENSYIGTNLASWLSAWPGDYAVDTVSTLNNEWKKMSFSGYDAVLHVAGIAHASRDPSLEGLYLAVNRDLAIEAAQKAKADGAGQFIFMSSILIYDQDGQVGSDFIITADTAPNPADFYGRSKLEADLAIQAKADGNFKTAVIRTPLVYGPLCKGNFPKLVKMAKVCPLFPDISNKRSMIYIDNLCKFLQQVIDNKKNGVFFPQNRDYMCTSDVVRAAAAASGKKVKMTTLFNPFFYFLSRKIDFINKVFGNKAYDKSLSGDFSYCIADFEESMQRCVEPAPAGGLGGEGNLRSRVRDK